MAEKLREKAKKNNESESKEPEKPQETTPAEGKFTVIAVAGNKKVGPKYLNYKRGNYNVKEKNQ